MAENSNAQNQNNIGQDYRAVTNPIGSVKLRNDF